MSTEASVPSSISLDAPNRLNSYLSEDGLSRVFHWGLNQDEDYTVKDWSKFLKGDMPFGTCGWASVGTGSGTKDVDNHAHIITTLAGQSLVYSSNPLYFDITDYINDNTDGNTFEITLKIDSYSSGGAIILLDDGTYSETLRILDDKIVLDGASLHYSMDTTDDFHTYTVVMAGDSVKVYVDKVFRIDTSLATASSGTKIFSFGNDTGACVSSWQFIKLADSIYQPIDLDLVDYEIQIDTSISFDSINLKDYVVNASSQEVYKDGVITGFIEPILPRQLDKAYTYYWRVKNVGSYYISDWTETLSFNLDQNKKDDIFKRMFNTLPDENVYTKDLNSGNIAALFKGEASEVDVLDFEVIRTTRDLSYAEGRDSRVGVVAGALLGVDSSSFNNIVEYRSFINNAISSFVGSTTKHSIQNVVKQVVGINPKIVEQRTKNGWIVNDNYVDEPKYYLKDDTYPGLGPVAQLFTSFGQAFTWELHVFNPYGLTYDTDLVENLVNKLKPAHTEVYFIYYDESGAVLLNPYYYGIDYYGLSYYTDKRFVL